MEYPLGLYEAEWRYHVGDPMKHKLVIEIETNEAATVIARSPEQILRDRLEIRSVINRKFVELVSDRWDLSGSLS